MRNLILKQGEVCDHCLGRQVALAFKGYPAEKIGAALRAAKKEADIKKNLEKKLKIYETDKCFVCEGLFLKIDDMFKKLIKKMNEQEFNTFLIGCRLSPGVQDREETLWVKVGMKYCDPIKREINKNIGMKAEKKTKKGVDFKHPDIVFILDFRKEKVFAQINSMFIYGKYKKLVRGLPQTKWPCRECGGRGCKKCKGTGRQYLETVEELIAESVLKATKAKHESFHGSGREDVNALMLGTGRPFVLEIKDPKIRNIDLPKLEKKVNKFAKGKVEVSSLRFSDKEEVRYLKKIAYEKTYEAVVKCKGITKKDLSKLEDYFKGRELSQRTPLRVLHRRADKIRKRIVRFVKTEYVSKNKFKATMKTEAGTYVKELISGDEGRTRPSFPEVLGKPCECETLDVTEIHEIEPMRKAKR